jgi:hypothetical protein
MKTVYEGTLWKLWRSGFALAMLALLSSVAIAQTPYRARDLDTDRRHFLYTSVDFPNAIRTRTFGISPRGVIVGDYRDSSGTLHGFLLVGGLYVTVDVPGALIGLPGVLPTGLRGINPAGDIVGIFIASPGSSEGCTLAGSPPCVKGFLLHRGTFSTVLFPGHEGSIPKGITPSTAAITMLTSWQQCLGLLAPPVGNSPALTCLLPCTRVRLPMAAQSLDSTAT